MKLLPVMLPACWLTICVSVLIARPGLAAEPEMVPEFEWAISDGGSLHDKTRGIAVDTEGNILLTGEFTGTATFGEKTLTAVGAMDFFVAKVDPNGKLAWLKSGGGNGYDYGHGIAADKLGNVFVTGAVVGDAVLDANPIGHPGPAHVFCLAMNSDGKLNWSRTAEGQGSSSGHAISVDQQGHCFVGGYASGHAIFGEKQLTTPTGHDILVAKFDAKGNLHWLHEGHGSANAMIHELVADSAGNVWASGMYQGDLKLADRNVANHGQHDLLLTHFDPTGKRLWTKTVGGAGIDYGLGVATDGLGNSFLTGSFTGRVEFDGTPQTSSSAASDILIVKYDQSGTQRWFQQAGSERTDHAYTIVADTHGNLYLSGACSGPAKFGNHSIRHQGSNDIFLAKMKTSK